ncbi:MAG: hypothetical protein KJ905_00165 [Nanoarchaeota archaeon]|nr:hypothetical protein [Nanoarchaeota archaeon]MBU1501175.1 hypothetical protein [Nanoarchaeota archaeon]
MPTQIQIKKGKYIIGIGLFLITLGLVFNGFLLGLGIMIIIFGIIYSIAGDTEIKWKCKSCEKKFESEKICAKHEIRCEQEYKKDKESFKLRDSLKELFKN